MLNDKGEGKSLSFQGLSFLMNEMETTVSALFWNYQDERMHKNYLQMMTFFNHKNDSCFTDYSFQALCILILLLWTKI